MNDVVYQPRKVNYKQGCPLCPRGYAVARPLVKNTMSAKKPFWIVCDTQPAIEGHIVIAPQTHIACMGALQEDLFSLGKKRLLEVKAFLQKTYGPVIVFEHGITGQTILHAHLNVLPFSGTIQDVVPEVSMRKEISGIDGIRSAYSEQGKYLYVEVQGKSWLVNTKLSKTGFFHRRLGAVQEGYKEYYPTAKDKLAFMRAYEKDIDELQTKWEAYEDEIARKESDYF